MTAPAPDPIPGIGSVTTLRAATELRLTLTEEIEAIAVQLADKQRTVNNQGLSDAEWALWRRRANGALVFKRGQLRRVKEWIRSFKAAVAASERERGHAGYSVPGTAPTALDAVCQDAKGALVRLMKYVNRAAANEERLKAALAHVISAWDAHHAAPVDGAAWDAVDAAVARAEDLVAELYPDPVPQKDAPHGSP